MQPTDPITDAADTAAIAPRNLAELKAFVERDTTLSASRRRDLASAIKTLATFLGQPMASLPADGRQLRPRVSQLHHAQLGVSKKRLNNVVSDFRAALRRMSTVFPRARYDGHLDPAWAELRARLPNNTKYVYHLSRAIRFFSEHGIAPADVDEAAFDRFREHLEANSLQKDPRKAHQAACRWWNKAAEAIEGWPQVRVTVPSFAAPAKTLPLETFPRSFRDDLTALRHRLTAAQPFDGKRRKHDGTKGARRPRSKPYAASTAAKWTEMLHRAASVLVTEGVREAGEITGVDVVCAPEAAEAVLEHHWYAAGEQATQYTALLAKVMKIVAEVYINADEAWLEDLAENVRALAPGEAGLTEKNAARLRQLNDPANKRMLLKAPKMLRDSAEATGVRRKQDAIDLMMAAATAVLIYAPLRISNLTNLSLSQHIRWPAREREPALLHLPAGAVKNGQQLDFELPPAVVDLLRVYVEKARGWWLGPEDDAVFPFGESEQARRYFGGLLSERVRRVTGLIPPATEIDRLRPSRGRRWNGPCRDRP